MHINSGEDDENINLPTSERLTVVVEQHPIMPRAPPSMQEEPGVIIVGGIDVGASIKPDESGRVKVKRGQRGPDSEKRQCRKCSLCLRNKGGNPDQCKGRGGKKLCEYYTE